MQNKRLFFAIATLAILSGATEAARILVIAPTISRSHHIWNRALTLALAKRGHQMTVLSPDPEKEAVPNLRHLNLEGSYEMIQDTFNIEEMASNSPFETLKDIWLWGIETCRHQVQTNAVKELLKMPPDSFDLIIMETVLNECMYMYIHHFGGGIRIPVVGITAFGIGPWTDIVTGARTMPSVFPFPSMPYLTKMNFWERFYNTIVTGVAWAGMLYYYLPEQHRIAEEAYGKPLPLLQDIGSNITLILTNNHYVLTGPQAQLPGIIEVGGMQCAPSKPLPKDMETFLNESEKGAIYFSLGSNLKSELLPKEKLKLIIETFSALGPKIRVIWKFDPKTPIEGLPSNVLIKKWLPQEDILGHPKILAFISHGGLLSTIEALYHGVPVIGVPFVADQHTNVRRMEVMKIGKKVDFLKMTKESFFKTIMGIIDDPSYRQNMQRISKLFRDQPQTPLELAVFWTEFTLRHDKGRVNSLISTGLELSWYQYFLLDVIAVILIGFLTVLLVTMYLIHSLYKMIKTSNNNDALKKSKKEN